MKRIMILFAASIISIAAYAQAEQTEVTKFLGIPVDGTKNEMVKKLKAKGFINKSTREATMLEGEFNGEKVHVYVLTNNNKVYRIHVADATTRDAYQIRLRYNTLIDQFRRNNRYYDNVSNYIPDTDNIYLELQTNPGKYDASFYQMGPDSLSRTDVEQFFCIYAYFQTTSPEMLDSIKTANPKEFIKEAIETGTTMPVDVAKNIIVGVPEIGTVDEVWDLTINSLTNFANKAIAENRSVWFRVNCFRQDQFLISMYYDNELNRASGKDL